jgi:hypothetical protein
MAEASAKEAEEIQLAAAETSRIRFLRLALVLATLAIGAAATTLTFIWLKKGITNHQARTKCGTYGYLP